MSRFVIVISCGECGSRSMGLDEPDHEDIIEGTRAAIACCQRGGAIIDIEERSQCPWHVVIADRVGDIGTRYRCELDAEHSGSHYRESGGMAVRWLSWTHAPTQTCIGPAEGVACSTPPPVGELVATEEGGPNIVYLEAINQAPYRRGCFLGSSATSSVWPPFVQWANGHWTQHTTNTPNNETRYMASVAACCNLDSAYLNGGAWITRAHGDYQTAAGYRYAWFTFDSTTTPGAGNFYDQPGSDFRDAHSKITFHIGGT